jgi:hypothetical protein
MSDEKDLAVQRTREIKVDDLLRIKSLSPSLVSRIQSADIDQDGSITSNELINAFLAEHSRHRDVLMLRKIAIGLCVMILIVLGTMGGAIYALVESTQKVNTQDGYIASKEDGMALASASLTVEVPLEKYTDQTAAYCMSAKEVRITDTKARTALEIGALTVSPNERTVEIATVAGYGFMLNSSGLYVQYSPEYPAILLSNDTALNATAIGPLRRQIE